MFRTATIRNRCLVRKPAVSARSRAHDHQLDGALSVGGAGVTLPSALMQERGSPHKRLTGTILKPTYGAFVNQNVHLFERMTQVAIAARIACLLISRRYPATASRAPPPFPTDYPARIEDLQLENKPKPYPQSTCFWSLQINCQHGGQKMSLALDRVVSWTRLTIVVAAALLKWGDSVVRLGSTLRTGCRDTETLKIRM